MNIIVLHNTDFAEGAVDASSVVDAARAVAAALRTGGHEVSTRGVFGTEILGVAPTLKADLVFNLCESMNNDARNEPTVAGLFDLFGIRYTGADQLALASCLHKQRAKAILVGCGVPTPPYRYFETEADLVDNAGLDGLDYPWFVKLAHEDASVGITEANRVTSAAELRARTRELFATYHQAVLGERYVEGREVNATLIGDGQVLPLHEIDFAAMPGDRPKIVSYAAKWDEHHVDYVGTKPVPLRDPTPGLVARVEAAARAAWTALGLRDYGRVDVRVDADGAPWVIDVNPNCDISPDAGAARAALAAGMPYDRFICRLAELAVSRPR